MSDLVQVPLALPAVSLASSPTRAQVFNSATEALRTRPGLAVVALDEHGLFCPIPAAVPLRGQRPITGYTSGIDFVVPADRELIVNLWPNVRHRGWAEVATRPALDPSCPAVIRVYDTSTHYGVYLGLVDMPGASEATYWGGGDRTLRPRFCSIRKDEFACILEVDDAFCTVLGWRPEDIVGRRSLELLDPEDHDGAVSAWVRMLAEPDSRQRTRLRHRAADDSWRWFEVTNHNRLGDAEHRDVLTEMVDITDEMSAHEQLRSKELLLRRLTETLPVGVLQFDSRHAVVYRNDRWEEILGSGETETLEAQLATLAPADLAVAVDLVGAVLIGHGDREIEASVVTPDGTTRRVTLALRALAEGDVISGGILCVTDVTDSVELREQLADRAMYDELTRALNRVSILSALQHQLDTAPDDGVGVVFIDLDGFKQVNDGLGHEAGDTILVEAARRLSVGVRHGDLVGRLGGDEFLVICPGVTTHTAAQWIGRRMAHQLTGPVDIGTRTIPMRASIGVAWALASNTDGNVLVADADQAMYESKRQGEGRPVVRGLAPSAPVPSPVQSRSQPRLRARTATLERPESSSPTAGTLVPTRAGRPTPGSRKALATQLLFVSLDLS